MLLLGQSPGTVLPNGCGAGGGYGGYGGGSANGTYGGEPYGSAFVPVNLGSQGGNQGSQGMQSHKNSHCSFVHCSIELTSVDFVPNSLSHA